MYTTLYFNWDDKYGDEYLATASQFNKMDAEFGVPVGAWENADIQEVDDEFVYAYFDLSFYPAPDELAPFIKKYVYIAYNDLDADWETVKKSINEMLGALL